MDRFSTLYRWSLRAAVPLALLVVVLGATVRLSDAGLGCPDWPGCYGHLTVAAAQSNRHAIQQLWPNQPLHTGRAQIEMIHRYAAAGLGLLIIAVAVSAWRRRRGRLGASLLVGLVVFQALLGMWTVTLRLAPVVVTAHLLGGLATLGLLWWLALGSAGETRGPVRRLSVDAAVAVAASPALRILAAVGLLLLLVQIALGGWTSSNHAALACQGFPSCNGDWWPSADFAAGFEPRLDGAIPGGAGLIAIHWAHRLGALTLALVLGTVAAVCIRAGAPWRLTGIAVASLVLAQAALGIANVLVGVPLPLAVAHNAGAALLLIAVLTLNYRLIPRRVPRRNPVARAPGPDAAPVPAGQPSNAGLEQTPLMFRNAPRIERAAFVLNRDAAGGASVAAAASPAAPLRMLADAWVARAAAIRWRAYFHLCKPRVVSLVVFTAMVSMCLAIPAGHVPWQTLVAGTLGITLAAASAAALNHIADRDIDALMRRTRRRPLPTHALELRPALVFALLLGVAATALLWLAVNPLTAVLALVTLIGYAVVYTRWLKWHTPQNIVLGGASGAFPAILGWTAATGAVQGPALALFLIVFVWTPPHFWPLAIARRDDYAAAGVPMLPVTHGVAFTRRRILAYAVALLPVSLMPCVAGLSGLLYAVGALLLGASYIQRAWVFQRRGNDQTAMALFRWSITYLSALFALMLVDRWLVTLLNG